MRRIYAVWNDWINHSDEEKSRQFERYRKSSDNFYLPNLLKDNNDIYKCLEIVKQNFDIIKIY